MRIRNRFTGAINTSASQRRQVDSGFTLIELLMVLVVLPIVMGAIATAIIISLRTSQATTNRLSDSVDSQITSAYYVRDVQGAGYLTQTTVASYSSSSPQVCPPSAPSGNDLLLGLYHPAPASGSALDVGYWQVGTASPYTVVRYSCSLDTSDQATLLSTATVAANVSNAAAVIEPSQFQATGWVPTVATTYVVNVSTSGNPYTMTVASTTGFKAGTINLATTQGIQELTNCTVPTSTTITCTVPSGVLVTTSQELSQNSVGDVNLAITQAPTNPSAGGSPVEYHYSLTSAPRTQSPWGAGPGAATAGGISPFAPGGGGGPSLLTLGTGGINVGQDAAGQLIVNGSVSTDGGSIACHNSNSISVNPGPIGEYNTTSGSNCPSTTSSSYTPDPLAPFLPSCFPVQPAHAAVGSFSGQTLYPPGQYTTVFPAKGDKGTIYLEPGVYELDAGLSLGSNQNLALVPGAPAGEGVLLYIPGTNTTPGCATQAVGGASVSLGAGGSVSIPPLDEAQSEAAFDGNPNLVSVWLWQDVTNSSDATLGGNSGAGSGGVAYLPSANVTLTATSGESTGVLICASITITGNGQAIIGT